MSYWNFKHFQRSEFACRCGCGFDTADAGLVALLEAIREHFDRRVFVTSACRCKAHNRSVGSKDSSQHVRGRACDIVVEGTPPDVVAELADQLLQGKGGVGRYDDFTHVDTRHGRARWNG